MFLPLTRHTDYTEISHPKKDGNLDFANSICFPDPLLAVFVY